MCLYLYKETSEVYTEMNCVYISFVGEIVTHTHTQLVFRFPNRPNVIGSSFDLNASQDTSLKKIKYIYEKSRRYKCKTTRNEIGSFFMFSTEIDKLLLKKWSINTNYITKKKFTILLLLILDFFFLWKSDGLHFPYILFRSTCFACIITYCMLLAFSSYFSKNRM